MRSFCIMLFVVILGTCATAQDSISVISSNLLEDLLENDEEASFDFFYLYDELQSYLKNPLDINKATERDLLDMQMLSPTQISAILKYKEDYGPFISKYELQAIPELDLGTLKALVPLIRTGSEKKKMNLKSLMKESSSNVFLKWRYVLQEREGFINDDYLGNRSHYFARYNFNSGRNIRAGFTAEKDPGEQFFTGSNANGFDYYTAFVHLRDVVPGIETLNIGDFTVSMGQGLIVHNSFGGGKSSFVTNIKKGGRVIRPYSSVNEGNFFRGVAARIPVGDKIHITPFYSIKNIDGSIQQDTSIDTGFESFSSIRLDGFHRTETEIRNENSISQQSYGGILEFNHKALSLNANVLVNGFSAPLDFDDDLFRKFRFRGTQLINGSIDYGYRFRNFNFFGEFAMSDNGGTAQVHGLLATLGRRVDVGLIYRDFDRDYQVLDANAFSESTQPINERGLYYSLLARLSNSVTASFYFDVWDHPWLRFQRDAPSDGREFLFKLEYNKKRRLNAYLQYRYEEKQVNGNPIDVIIDPLIDTKQHRFRLHVTNTLSKDLKLRNRFEFNVFSRDGEVSDGYLLYQDIIYKPLGKPYSFTARYSLFDTDGFDTRIYTYENDILYEFSIPFFADRGTRFYINWRQKIGRKITAELRYSRTNFDNRTSVGSGDQLIDGNIISEVKAQIKYKFQ